MRLEHFICLLIGIVLTSIFHHLYFYNGKIKFDSSDPTENSFKLCIIKMAKIRKRKYIVLKIEKEHYIKNR